MSKTETYFLMYPEISFLCLLEKNKTRQFNHPGKQLIKC